MDNICTKSTIGLLHDVMPPVYSKDICPGTRHTQCYKSLKPDHETAYNSPVEYCRPKKVFSMRPLITLPPKTWKKLDKQPTAGKLILTWRRPEIKILYQRLKCKVQPEDRTPLSTQMLRHFDSSIMQGFPNLNSVEPPTALQKQMRTFTSQTWLMITTNWQFL
jgi:hypothetical protein